VFNVLLATAVRAQSQMPYSSTIPVE